MPDTIGLGKTYATLALKEAAATGEDGECYKGSNLGAMIENSGAELEYYVAAGNGHDGTDPGDDPSVAAGVYNATTHAIAVRVSNLTVKNLVIRYGSDPGTSVQGINFDGTGPPGSPVIDGNMIIFDCDNESGSVMGLQISNLSAGSKIINNIVVRKTGHTTSSVFRGINGAVSSLLECSNNTIVGDNTAHSQRGLNLTSVTTTNGYNNICLECASDYYDFVRTNSGNNMSSDTSGDSGYQSITAAAVLTDPYSDWNPLGAALDSGEDRSAQFSTDGAGSLRPQGEGWEIGAIELVVAVAEEITTAERNILTIPKMGLGMGIN